MTHSFAGRLATALLFAALLCVSLASAAWAGGGNSANAKLCQKGGWQQVFRADGSAFTSPGDCVSYAARGGTVVIATRPQIDCQSFGGTFTAFTGGNEMFACDGWSASSLDDFNSHQGTLLADCYSVGGTSLASVPDPPALFPASVDSACANVG